MSDPDDHRRARRVTRKGVFDPSERAAAAAPTSPKADAPGESGERAATAWPEIEHMHVLASDASAAYEATEHVEVWTAHHVYVLDSALVCRKVVDRGTDTPLADHRLLGSRLLGGQGRRDDGAIAVFSRPFPGYGQAAVFGDPNQRRPRMTETSAVERLLIRQRTIVIDDGEEPKWERITSRHAQLAPADDDE